jgi:hypothetical protein
VAAAPRKRKCVEGRRGRTIVGDGGTRGRPRNWWVAPGKTPRPRLERDELMGAGRVAASGVGRTSSGCRQAAGFAAV